MRRILSLLLACALILSAPQSLAQVSVDATKVGGGAITAAAWDSVGSASSAGSSALRVITDLGEHGSLVVSNGTRWRAVNGVATLKNLGAPVTGITNSEQIAMQALLPAGAWQVGDVIRIRITAAKSGGTDTGTLTVRIGTAGTTGDTAVTGLSAFSIFSAAAVSGGYEFDLKLVSATSVQKVGNAATQVSAFGAGSASAAPAATTISDASANALFISVGLASSGTTNTMSLTSGSIQLVTP